MSGLDIYLIRPTRYDEEGYPIQWMRTHIPSNSLACVYGIAQDCADRKILGEDVQINLHAMDDYNTPVVPEKIIKQVKKSGNKALICMVGVQTNQFPRSVDLSRPFLDAGIPVCIGGFHVSGCLSMLKEMPADIVEAQELGISFFAGEAEERRFDQVVIDAYNGELKSLYDFSKDTPSMENTPAPILPIEEISKTFGTYSSFDLGRGCPFDCSFCTIINVQGRKSRFRTADDLEAIIRQNHAIGVNRFFLTDDNFARNKNWKQFTDRMIKLRKEGIPLELLIQVDTLCHKIDGFIEACVAAGTGKVFVGLENINSDSLELVGKRQNRIEDYREMLLAWKRHPVFVICGYILGFPTDTKESILQDVETIKRYLPIDGLSFSFLTPLPGSMDHKKMYEAGEWLDPDMNRYNLFNRVSHHPVMSDKEWEDAFREAHLSFFSWEHMNTIFKRMVALRSNKKYATIFYLLGMKEFTGVDAISPLEGGVLRRRMRRQRRPGFKIESPFVFYPKFFWRELKVNTTIIINFVRLWRMMRKAWTDPARYDYMDDAITSVDNLDADELISKVRTTEYAEKRRKRNSDKTAQTAAE